MFGENGAVLTEGGDEETENLFKKNGRGFLETSLVGFLLATAQVFLSAQIGFDRIPFWWMLVLLSFVFAIAPALIGFFQETVEAGKLPTNLGIPRQHEPISPILVALFLALGLLVAIVVNHLFVNYNSIHLGDETGGYVLLATGVVFALMVFGPQIWKLRKYLSRLRFLLFFLAIPVETCRRIGIGISIFDAWLVHVLSPVTGIKSRYGLVRYGYLLCHLILCALIAWFFPNGVGLFAVFWAFLVSVSVARRWAWTEADRELILRVPDYETDSLKVGAEEDLRDEALFALMSLIAFLPLSMRVAHATLAHLDITVFGQGENGQESLTHESFNNFFLWLKFFGAELAKAIPFIDWADIFSVDMNSTITSAGAVGSLTIFFARVIVDLVFLAALLQAISIGLRWARHKQSFFAQEIDRLDVMIERDEFSKLAYKSSGKWEFSKKINKFMHYHEFSLLQIRLHSNDEAAHEAATEILRRRNISLDPASEQFLTAAFMEAPDIVEITLAFRKAQKEDDLDIDGLSAVLSKLNGLPPFNVFRTELIHVIIGKPPTQERNTALRYILTGRNSDSIASNRQLALEALAEHQARDKRIKKAIEDAAATDGSKRLKKRACELLRARELALT